MPPFNSFFLDEKEWLYVMTYEKGENEDEYIHDIFNSNGIFIARKNIKNYGKLSHTLYHLKVSVKNNRLYCLREKEDEYKELLVYKMRWE